MPHLRFTAGFRSLVAALLIQPLVPVAARAAEPSIEQIHALAADGHLDQALAQMAPVLKAHPGSAKAHYVEAELLARADHATQGRAELARAEQISPGLPFADVYSVAELNRQLSLGPASPAAGSISAAADHRSSAIPWIPIATLGAAAFGLYMLFRRRPGAIQPSLTQSPFMRTTSVPTGGGVWGNPAGSGMGSGLLGNLAGGAAMGAGFAVGEEAIDRMFRGDEHRETHVADDDRDANQDMGGNDFGIADGESWDDSSSDGGGW